MKKTIQNDINQIVEKVYAEMNKEIDHKCGTRLRHCSAWVYESKNFYSLRSYNTVIACIDKRTKFCYDFLRKVYGYTRTSAQHISKFKQDYGAIKTLTYYLL